MSNYALDFKIPEEIKNQAFAVIESYGLTPNQAFDLFLNEIAQTQTLPFNPPFNQKTLDAIQELNQGGGEGFSANTPEELIQIMKDIVSGKIK